MFSRGKERYVLKHSDVRDVAAKTPFDVNHGFLAFTNGWVGSDGSKSETANECRVDNSAGSSGVSLEDIFKARSR